MDTVVQLNVSRISHTTEAKEVLPPPASPHATPADTARAQANAAAHIALLSAPSPDGIYTIGAVSMKAPDAVRPIARSSLSSSSWGF